MADPIRIGVVGLGQWGQHHVRIYHQMPGTVLAGVADTASREASNFARRYNTTGFRDYRELFGRVDAVSLVVPTALHYEIAREFLEHDIHVLVEKPITTSVDQAAELVELAQRRGLVLLVGHVERFKPAVQRLRDLVRDPLFIQVRRVRPWNPRRIMDVGVVLDLMIHDLDIVLHLMRTRVSKVSAVGAAIHGEDEDLAVAHLTLRGGCMASFVASRVSPVKVAELEITLPDGFVHLNYLGQQLTVRRDGDEQRLTVPAGEPLRAELTHFVQCVRGENVPLVSGEDGLRALEVALEILQTMTVITPRVAV
ncbi:MAG TPA: Gfo/Idh/MocA family oxidoreductase [bacterium]|nr:Gfo/Idh/MocA family oxidoreductase [bacterium]